MTSKPQSDSELDKIIKSHLRGRIEGYALFKQVLVELMLEVVGNDEQIPNHKGTTKLRQNMANGRVHARNKLRAELRVKIRNIYE